MNLLDQFKNYLFSQEVKPAPVTVKNYLSDINHFVKWFEKQYGTILTSPITNSTLEQYKTEFEKSLSPASMQRHLSSLRKFFKYLKTEGKMTIDPFEESVINKKQEKDVWRLKDFKNNLFVNKAAHLTIKNYIIDVKQFVLWAKEVTGLDNDLLINRLSKEFVEEYKQRLIKNDAFSPATVNRKLSSLRKYLSFAQENGLLTQNLTLVGNINEAKQKLYIPSKEEITADQLDLTNPSNKYSKFPPLRLMQKFSQAGSLGFDTVFIAPLAKIASKIQYSVWKLRGQPIFEKGPQTLVTKNITAHDLLGIRNISKQLYAPFKISTQSFSTLQKLFFHLRYTRPNWYKRYHSYSITHYFHFAVLVIFLAAVGFGIYNSFFTKPQNQPALAALPTAPPRILSFQGRLTDNNDNPITSNTNIRFAIYNNLTASGAALLWQEVDPVTPDVDGIFNAILGNVTSIPSTLFSENAALYLGVTIETTPELTPRQQLATVAYATNSETLQGLPPITAVGASTSNVVLALDSSGNLTIGGTANPSFSASGGQFKLSGQPLLLTTNTGTDANVQITTDDLGKIDLQKPILNSTNSNNIATAIGAVEVNDLFAVLATSSGQSAFTINQTSTGPIISASSGGTAKFTIDNSGNEEIAGNLTAAGTTGISLSGNGAGITFSGTGNHDISASSGTLRLGALTLTGAVTGNSQSITGLNNLSAAGTVTFSNFNANNNILYATVTTGVLAGANTSTTGQCLISGASAPSWSSCSGAVTTDVFWSQANGTLYANNSTVDLLIGGQATTSAKFAVLNINSGTPVASVSSGLSGTSAYLTADGTLATQNRMSLTIGNSSTYNTTGNVLINPNGTGNVGIGTTAPASVLDVRGQATIYNATTNGKSLVVQSSPGGNRGGIDSSGALELSTDNSTNINILPAVTNNLGLFSVRRFSEFIDSAISISSERQTISVAPATYTITGGYTTQRFTNFAQPTISAASALTITNADTVSIAGAPTVASSALITNAYGLRIAAGAVAAGVTNAYGLSVSAPTGATNNYAATFATGNVGIGTTGPSGNLHINSTGNTVVNIDAPAANYPALQFLSAGSVKMALLRPENTSDLKLDSNTVANIMYWQNGGNVGIGTSNPGAKLDITGTLRNSSTVTFSTFTSNGGVLYTTGTGGQLAQVTAGSATQCLLGGTTPVFGSCATGPDQYWNSTLGALYPNNSTVDFFIGGQATTSAKFAVLNINSGTPTASISANSGNIATYLTGLGNLQTTNSQTLTLGGTTTGLVNVNNKAGSAFTTFDTVNSRVGIGTTTPTVKLDVRGANAQGWGEGKGLVYLGGDTTTSDTAGLMMDINVLTSPNQPGMGLRAKNRPNPGDGQTSPAWYQVYIDDGGKIGTGTITNAYGLYVVTPTVATNNYAAYFAGNVGIGNTAPLTALDVTGSASLSANLSLRGAAIAHTFNILDNGTLNIQRSPGGDAGLTTALFVQNNGNVGIGTTGPSEKLEVSGVASANIKAKVKATAGASAYLVLGSGHATTPDWNLVSAGDTGNFFIYDNGISNARLTIQQTGNVGIGLTGPAAKLDISAGGTALTAAQLANAQLKLTRGAGSYAGIWITGVSASDMFFGGAVGSDDVIISTANQSQNQIIRFAQGGNVGVGTDTTPDSLFSVGSTSQFQVNSSGAIAAAAGITSSGGITFSTFTSNGGPLYTNGSGVLAQTTAGSSTQCLLGGTTPVFGACSTGPDSIWQQANGAIYPNNSTVDFLIGGQATTSAKFAVLNINSGTPTASISANSGNNATYLTGDGTLATTNRQSLTIGNSSTYNTTGNVLINPNGTGNVGIGTTGPSTKLHVYAGASGVTPILAPVTIESNGNAYISILTPNTAESGLVFGDPQSAAIGSLVYNHATDKLSVNVGGANPVTITSTNVGIGNTTPLTALDVTGSASLSANLSLRGAATAHTFNILDNGTLNIQRSPGGDAGLATALFVQNNGRVGIGTAGPTEKLDLEGNLEMNYNEIRHPIIYSGYTSSGEEAVIQNFENDLARANERYTVTTSEAPDAGTVTEMFDGNVRNGAQWNNATTTYPIIINVDRGSTLDRFYAFGIEFIYGLRTQSVKIEVSPDNSAWTTVLDTTTNTRDSVILRSAQDSKRYIRYTLANPASTSTYVSEIMAYSSVTSMGQGYALNIGGGTMYGTLGMNNNIIQNIGNAGTDFDSSGGLTLAGTLTANGVANIGDNGDNVVINSNTWDVTGAGVLSGLTGITSSGTITFSTFTSNGGPLYANGSGVLAQTTAGSSTQCLLGGTTPAFGSCASGPDSIWQQANGAIYPNNSTVDFLVGGQATTSAKFAVLNVNSGTPVASVSSGLSGTSAYLTADGTLATQNRMSLTIGNSSTYNTTGNVLINPNGTGNVGIGTTAPGAKLQINTTVGGADALILRDETNSANARFYFTSPLGGPPDLNIAADRLFIRATLLTNLLQAISGTLTLGTANPVIIGTSPTIDIKTDNANTTVFHGGSFSDTIIRPYSSSYNIQLAPDGGNVGIGTTSPLGTLDVRGNSGTTPVASISGQTSFAALVVDNKGVGDIFTASTSGYPRFTITNQGNVVMGKLGDSGKNLTIYGSGTAPSSISLLGTSGNGVSLTSGYDGVDSELGAVYGLTVTAGNGTIGDITFRSKYTGSYVNQLRILGSNNNVGIGTITPTSELHVTRPLSFGATGKALAIFDQIESQDILTASASGTSRFTVTNAGGIKLGSAEGSANNCLLSGGAGVASSWGACTAGGGVVTSVTGTANQITSSPTTGAVVLSIPSDFRAPGTVNAVSGLYTGATAGTQRIDASGNLVNIGTIASGAITTTGTLTQSGGYAYIGSFNSGTTPTYPTAGTALATAWNFTNGSRDISLWNTDTANNGTSNPSFIFRQLTGASSRSDLMTIQANGNVGIGTTSPTSALYVTRPLSFGVTGKALAIFDQIENQDIFAASASGTNRFVIQNGGNVGIGTTAPAEKLHVEKTGDVTTSGLVQVLQPGMTTDGREVNILVGKALSVGNSGLFGYRYDTTSGDETAYIAIYGDAAALNVRKGGNVGIGTTGPIFQTEVYGTGQLTAALTDADTNRGGTLSLNGSSTSAGSGGALLFGNSQSHNVNSVGFAAIKGLLTSGATNTVGDLAFSTRNAVGDVALTERMRILAGGFVGIGTTAPGASLQTGANFTNLNARLLTSNAAGWAADGQTPSVVISNSTTATTYAANIGLALHNDSTTVNSYSPFLMFSRRSPGSAYNNAYAGIGGQATGTGVDTNWVAGDLVFTTTAASSYQTEKMRILGSGNVGIGTTGPDLKLDVVGYGKFGDSDTNPATYDNGLTVTNANGTPTSLFLWQQGIGSGHIGFRASDSNLYIVNSYSDGLITNSAAITLGTTGNVTFAGALSGITTISTSSTINSQTISSAANFTGTLNVVGTISGNSKEIFLTTDTYLRLNQSSTFTAGVWFGTSNILGSTGYLAVGSNGGTTTSNIYLYGGTWDGTNNISLNGDTGAVTAGSFSGVGSGLTSVDAATLDSIDSTQFAQSKVFASTDFNSETGYSGVSSINGSTNTPFGAAWYNLLNNRHRGGISDGNVWGSQIATGMTGFTNRIAMRVNNGTAGSWTAWNEIWTAGSDGSTSGLDADVVDGYNPSATAGTANRIVLANGSGYIDNTYFNTTANVTAGAASHFAIQTSSDNYIRWQTPSNARTSLGLGTGDSPSFSALTLSGNSLTFGGGPTITAGTNQLVFNASSYSYFQTGTVYIQNTTTLRGAVSNDTASTGLQLTDADGAVFGGPLTGITTLNASGRITAGDIYGAEFRSTGGTAWQFGRNANLTNQCNAGGSINSFCWTSGTDDVAMLSSGGQLTLQSTLIQSTDPDLAENINVLDTSIESGDIVSSVVYNSNENNIYYKAVASKTTTPYSPNIIGAISEESGFVLNNIMDEHLNVTHSPNMKPMTIAGRIPVKVSTINGEVKTGDPITSSEIPGIGMKSTKPGTILGTALSDYVDSNATQSAKLINGKWETQNKTCDIGEQNCYNYEKILVLINMSFYDPDVMLTSTGNLNIVDSNPLLSFNTPHIYVLNDPFGLPIDRVGAFADLAVAKLTAGFISAKQISTDSLTIASSNVSIAGQSLYDYISAIVSEQIANISNLTSNNIVSPIASIDTLKTGFISPIAQDSSIGIKVDKDKIEIVSGNSATNSAVASFDTQGNATFSGVLSSRSLEVKDDASISGTLRARRIIADQIEGLNIKASTVSANYITNVTNVYNSSSSAFPTLPASPSGSTQYAIATNGYINIATFSSQLAYVENLNSVNGVFSQNLSVFGNTTLSDTSVVGQLAIGGSLILASNSINVLGSDLSLQPLRQGGLSIMAGIIYIDTNGNVKFGNDATVNGTLYAGNISPITGKDLTIKLASDSANTQKIVVRGASNSAVFAIDNLGNIIASGAATISKLNINSIVAPALAVSPTEMTATGSAGVAKINAGRVEMTINNPLVTENSLIYITPTSNTQNQVLYLLRQIPGESFTVGIQNPSTIAIPFNWIIVN